MRNNAYLEDYRTTPDDMLDMVSLDEAQRLLESFCNSFPEYKNRLTQKAGLNLIRKGKHMPRRIKGTVVQFLSPKSSSVHHAEYEPSTETMIVYFTNIPHGDITCSYGYQGVPADVWKMFESAESKGKFMLSHIKPKFSGIRL